jgi:hypothetical protein
MDCGITGISQFRRAIMGLFKAIEDLCSMDGPLGDATTTVLEGICECAEGIGDALQGFADKLGEVEKELAGEDGEESCWAVDRLDPEWESTPKLKATRDAVDSIVNFCDRAADAIDGATLKIMEMTEKALN